MPKHAESKLILLQSYYYIYAVIEEHSRSKIIAQASHRSQILGTAIDTQVYARLEKGRANAHNY